jgi:tRNA-Thr(GGU) m(6)t(6)A37 methyltransferase TsaA
VVFQYAPIGLIRSPFRSKFGINRQASLLEKLTFRLELAEALQPAYALDGLDGFSHLWVIWHFHALAQYAYHPKIHPPRLQGTDGRRRAIGVFASRSPHRPNPIGLSLVQIKKVLPDAGVVLFSGGDFCDQTPVLDIKPYLPEEEIRWEARCGWLSGLKPDAKRGEKVASRGCSGVKTASSKSSELLEPFTTEPPRAPQLVWSTQAQDSLRALGLENKYFPDQDYCFLEQVEQVLSFDPRPRAYKKKSPNKTHVFNFFGYDIFFRALEGGGWEILDVKNGFQRQRD